MTDDIVMIPSGSLQDLMRERNNLLREQHGCLKRIAEALEVSNDD